MLFVYTNTQLNRFGPYGFVYSIEKVFAPSFSQVEYSIVCMCVVRALPNHLFSFNVSFFDGQFISKIESNLNATDNDLSVRTIYS